MLENIEILVPPDAAGRRLDRFLAERLAEFDPRSVSWAVESGAVSLDGSRAPKGLRLSGGERLLVRRIAEAADWLPVPGEPPGAAVIYDDGTVAVLDKPAGCHTEPQRPLEAGTLAGLLRARHPEVERLSGTAGLTLLTRLDHDTSGAVLAALSAEAFAFLREERARGGLRKSYLCVVAGRLSGTLEIGYRIESRGGARVRVRRDAPEEEPLYRTTVEPVRALDGFTLVRAAIRRGKRHQVRAHLAAAGHPIAGDPLYGAGTERWMGGERLWLHAEAVEFRHPSTLEQKKVESPIPDGFGLT